MVKFGLVTHVYSGTVHVAAYQRFCESPKRIFGIVRFKSCIADIRDNLLDPLLCEQNSHCETS